VQQHFTWHGVVKAYEQLWLEQEFERRKHESGVRRQESGVRSRESGARRIGPPCYPAPEVSFAGYPTTLLGDDARVLAGPKALDELRRFLTMPLCAYAGQRVKDEQVMRTLLSEAASPRSLNELAELLTQHGADFGVARATLAWLLKYGLLRRA
jgi:hypothetical protein